MPAETAFDILQMPFDGLAAYWLSIKKLTDSKKGRGVVDQEIEGTEEPFVRHVLELAFCELPSGTARRMIEARMDTRLEQYAARLELMRLAAMAVASGENPRMTLIRMHSLFAEPPIDEDKAFAMANGLTDGLTAPGADLPTLLVVDHRQPEDRLVVKLLFYVLCGRREGPQALLPYLEYPHLPLFAEGLAQAVDGFDAAFVSEHMQGVAQRLLDATRRKMQMSMEMALGIRARYSYADIYRIARSYMP